MKKSKDIVRTVVLGSALIAGFGCSKDEEQIRNQYASKADCVKDFQDAGQCYRGEGEHRANFFGPWYFYHHMMMGSHFSGVQNSRMQYLPKSQIKSNTNGKFFSRSQTSKTFTGTKTVSRGGFGRSSSSYGGRASS